MTSPGWFLVRQSVRVYIVWDGDDNILVVWVQGDDTRAQLPGHTRRVPDNLVLPPTIDQSIYRSINLLINQYSSKQSYSRSQSIRHSIVNQPLREGVKKSPTFY